MAAALRGTSYRRMVMEEQERGAEAEAVGLWASHRLCVGNLVPKEQKLF